MILCDTEIHELITDHAMVQHYQPKLINPASLDLRLGNLIMLESVTSHQMIPLSIKDYTADHPYDLVPGQFILAQTMETFNMPEDIAGLFFLKSSRAREGYENLHAGYADPGWHGSTLTLELKNARQLQPLPIYPGLKIGQMVFFRMSTKPAISYADVGHYNNDALVSSSKQFLSSVEMPRLDAAA
jgi:dCTP deaminase